MSAHLIIYSLCLAFFALLFFVQRLESQPEETEKVTKALRRGVRFLFLPADR
jgi:hypothetical protein